MRIHQPDGGLSYDLPRLLSRRRALSVLGAAGVAAALAGCTTRENGSTGADGAGPTTEIPEEAAGPFPGDGSNGPNVLTESGVVRSDITRSFGSASGVAEGVPLTVKLRILDVSEGAAPLEGAAVYVWHCDREGRYSLYSEGATGENYLRGVQAADAAGWVTFTSVFPAAYAGRWPHIHFEVYPSLEAATGASDKLRTSQLAFPEDICRQVYATDGYEQSVRNLEGTSLDSDNVFRDGYSLQLATVTGTVADGLVATLNVPV